MVQHLPYRLLIFVVPSTQRPSKIQANEKAPKRNGGVDIAQVQNGKGAMPAWSGQLSEDEIQSVAAYVFNQADKGLW